MVSKNVYLGLSIIGFILPYSQFLSFLFEYGLNFSIIYRQIIGSYLSAFAWLDVLVSAVVVILMVLSEKDEVNVWWLPILATLTIGASCGLPLFLYLRD